jgi:RimJ/RimL family protein N-acetyltransferase
MPIETDRLILRTFTQDDFADLRELDGNPTVLRYRSRQHIRPEMTREFLDRAHRSIQERPRTFYAYAVVLRDRADWLGQCGLTVVSLEVMEAFVWFALLPRHWGHGYMTEAVQALVRVGRTEFKLHQIFAECHPDNRAAIRVMERAGLAYEGRIQRIRLTEHILSPAKPSNARRISEERESAGGDRPIKR